MGTLLEWLEANPSKTGEVLTENKMRWIQMNQQRLRKAFPRPEQAFCRIIDKLKSRMPQWRKRLVYNRQKWFIVSPEFVFFGDFYFSNMHMLVEIDGQEHQGNKEWDGWRTKMIGLFRCKVKVVRITNDAAMNSDFRLVERWFASEVVKMKGCGHFARDYEVMTLRYPDIYQHGGIVKTWKD